LTGPLNSTRTVVYSLVEKQRQNTTPTKTVNDVGF
jgi:hypothetical protein